ncbi:TonB-dependent siderophore receptor [Paraburkholderia steynii]|uniref:TonB-dependent siderophore receptor n=1 Tax=Paraburkholderia steynii TaxID=1245441 RepID=A0A4R0XFA4_9BURK|nr:TonB-dependent siderophore receptor [Paraburkholderia steynii]
MFTQSVLALAVAAALPTALFAQTQSVPASDAQGMSRQAQEKSFAQELVDITVARHPELIELDLHARPPGTAQSLIVAAKSPQRIGKLTDRDDLAVFKSGEPLVEVNESGRQNVEAHVPLYDAHGAIIGVVEMTFPYPAGSGFDKIALIRTAAQVRDEISRRIAHADNLFEPVRFDPRIPLNTYAQSLVDDTLAKYPHVVVLAMHVKPPGGGTDYPIIASNIGRIGKPADEDDIQVITTGKTSLEVNREDDRFEVKLPLQDKSGNTIGALGVIFPYTNAANQSALQQRAEAIRDALRAHIPDSAKLFEPGVVKPVAATVAAELDKSALGNKQSLPMTRQEVSSAALQGSQDGLSDAVKNQAGVAPTNSKGSPADAQSIRGIKLNLFSNYRLNGGLPIAGVVTTPTDNKARIETLKGANALMFGVASPAGIINLVTKRATERDVTSLILSGNSFGQYGAGIDIGRRFGSEKQFGLRANLSGAHLENGVHGANGHGWFASLGADWRVTDRLSFQFDFEQYRKEVVEQASINLPAVVNGQVPVPRVPDPRNLLSGPWAVYSPTTTNVQGRVDYIINESWKALVEVGRSYADRSRLTGRIAGYNVQTGAGGVETVNTVTQEYINRFERAELLGKFATGPFRHDLTLGVSRSERDAETPAQNVIVLPQPINIYDPIPLPAPVPTRPSTSLPLQTSSDSGLYAYDNIGIGQKWKVLIGFRETRSVSSDGRESQGTYLPLPAAGILYDVLPTTTLFASYMKGLEDGGVAPVNAVNAYQILAPAVSTQKEIGIRDSYFEGLSITASYFIIDRVNAVTNSATKVFSNDGTIKYRGAEAVVTKDFGRQWSVTAALQWLRAVQNPVSDMSIKGLTPENTPRWIGNVSVTHRPSYFPGLALTLGASFVSQRPVNPQDQGYIPGYVLLSAGAAYSTLIGGHRASFLLSVDNLTNRRYWNSVQTGTLGTGMDRSIRLNAKFDF